MKILSSIESKLNGAVVAALLISLVLFTTICSSNASAAIPVADFAFEPAVGNTSSVIRFNASSSSNPGGNFLALSFRWDWQDDGTFDTSWSSKCTAEHQYTSPGIFHVRLEVKNPTGQIGNATAPVPIDGSGPAVTLLLPDGSSFKNGSKVSPGHASIICISIDELSSIASVEFSLDAADFENVSSSTSLNQTTITMNGLADGDHYLIVRVTNSAGLTTLVGVDFIASAAVVEEPPLDSIWIVVTILVVAIGIVVSLLLVRWRWKKNPPEGLDLTPPGLPPVM
jgi:PKD repeat protein